MVSVDNSNLEDGIREAITSKVKDLGAIEISTSPSTIISKENRERNLPDTMTTLPNRIKFLKFGSVFPKSIPERNQIPQSVPSSASHGLRKRFSGMFSKKLDWVSLSKMCKDWFRNPMNMALFLWIACVAISGAILFLVMTGMLNSVLPKKSQRNVWFEINNQILNALFTLMCLYQHPKRFHHLVLLCRWKPNDILILRKVYCKNGTYKPHEWTHMIVVVILLHVNCFAQYALCGLNLGYKRSERPAVGVGICISVAIAAPAIAGVYTILSPLGMDYDSEMDEKPLEKKYSFATRDEHSRVLENRPQWRGGILHIWEGISIAYLSLFCTFCVFGRNMERLGFGNMYVHMATFILFCTAPIWIFILAAVNIDSDKVRQALVGIGIVLCVFGLLYGGFWRIQMRKRFNLPEYAFCFGEPSFSDCTLWLCCCWCSLAQEVRTGNSYDVVEDKLCRKPEDICEDGVLTISVTSSSVKEKPLESGKDGIMSLPAPAFILRDGPSPLHLNGEK